MDLDKLTLFSMVKKRLNWLGQRQEVLAQNIANADTPGYAAKDLKPFEFKELIRRESAQLNMETTGSDHLGGKRRKIRDYAQQDERHPFETSSTGNSVILEEQMAKINETSINHRMTTELYRKHLGMIATALGKGR